MPVTFVRPQLMKFGTSAVTDHNRAALSVTTERIEKKQRMANGTLRKYVVADKRTFSTSWTMLPKSDTQTVDGFWGGQSIESFYYSTPGSFTLTLADADGTTTNYTVMFSSYSREVVKRGSVDFWNVNVTLEEV